MFRSEGMSPGFHSYAYRHSGGYQFAVEFLRFLAVLQSALAAFASFGIHKRNLLETRVVVTTLHLVCIYSIRSLCRVGDWIGIRREAVHIHRRRELAAWIINSDRHPES